MIHRLLLAALLLSCAAAQAQPLHRYSTSFELSQSDFVDSIDIEFTDDQVYLPVDIGGRRYRFLLDTGSSQGVVYSGGSLAALPELGNIVSRDANHRLDTVRVVQLPPLRIGPLGISGYVCTVVTNDLARRRCDGIIGFDLINKGLECKIDTRAGLLILTDRPRFFRHEGGHELKYRLKWFVPHVWVSPFMRHDDEALFDTGARQLYAMNKESFDRHVYKSRQVAAQVEGRARGSLAIGHGGAESEDEVVFLALNRLRWADFSFTDVHCITTQGGSRLGAALLRYGAVVLSPHRRRIVLQPYEGGAGQRVGNRPFDIAYVPREGRPAVGLVRPGSRPHQEGFRAGDVILSIDGQATPTFASFVGFPFVEGRSHVFLLRRRDGKLAEVSSVRVERK